MNIIEQAARRLEELRRSGVEIPTSTQRGRPANGMSEPMVLPGQRTGVPVSGSMTPAATSTERGRPSANSVEFDLRYLVAMGYITPDTPRTQIANEFRVIKRPILSNVNGHSEDRLERANLIMVTSSMPDEGKTFVAINLALSIAMERDSTVLLVDADVSRPSVLERMGLAPAPGLLDVLSDASRDVGDLILRTNIEKLSILPAGTPSGNATELLASVQMKRLLDEMGSRYADRVLVFDSPPLLPSPESRVLASRMGQVVVVVQAEHTVHQTLIDAMSTLDACPVVMPLLNKSKRSGGGYYGYDAQDDA